MRRREFLGAMGSAAVAWPLAAHAQQSQKPARLGYFAPAANADLLAALHSGLRDFGYVEGQNLAIEHRYVLGQSKSYDELAAELVRLSPDVIVVVGTPPALAAKRQTSTIPIVMAPAADQLRSGLVGSISRPGGNVSGVSLFGSELARKRMEVLKEAVAGIRRIGVLENAGNPLHRVLWEELQPAGPALGLEFRPFAVSDLNELPAVIATVKRDGFDGLTHLSDAQFFLARRRIGELAAAYRLPRCMKRESMLRTAGSCLMGRISPI